LTMARKRKIRHRTAWAKWRTGMAAFLLLVMSLTGGCFSDPEVEPYYGSIRVPGAQEFRWSSGGLPQTFDPALAAAPPETDIVRAMFEGLTDYDPTTLAPVPGVATRWESAHDAREWTFHLRRDARWSNGQPVTARDFIDSWKRTLALGERAPHVKLMENIVGAGPVVVRATKPEIPAPEPTPAPTPTPHTSKEQTIEQAEAKNGATAEGAPVQTVFGAEALDDYTLRVRLQRPDTNFPALVAHPVFRPVHEMEAALPVPLVAQQIVSNGPFRLSKSDKEGVVLERAGNYWDAKTVNLERVQFVPAKDAEAALAAYRAGEVDAVSNAAFEPLALKLLAPYKDFHRVTFGALTYYSFNITRAPFDDVRVREALAIVIDRERIVEDQMGGATEPAKKFLPEKMAGEVKTETRQPRLLVHDVARAQRLLAESGFPQGKGFPVVQLLVNRNEQQRQVAQTVASMWRNLLGIETEVVVKSWDEYEAALSAGDYDVVRRGIVMQTTDEETNLRLMFEQEGQTAVTDSSEVAEQHPKSAGNDAQANAGAEVNRDEKRAVEKLAPPTPVLTEEQALRELPAIPIYFASSYSLVKPYVVGFEQNLLDAHSLKRVRIDTGWKPPPPTTNAIIWLKK
jgi:oligopeptide transport system substrate-binding protein